MFTCHLLGEIGLRGPDGQSLDRLLRQPKRMALLAYLAAPSPGVWHRRDTILGLFWPELSTPRARTSLRTAVYVLRQALGDETIRSRGDEELSVDPERLTTDLQALLAALAAGDANEALRLYRGDLLAGLYPSNARGFEEWLARERGQLRSQVAGAALQLVAALESEKRWGDALSAARRVLAIQPEDETVVRRLMLLHEAAGDHAGALACFEEYRAFLKVEYAAPPAPETLVLAGRLRGAAESDTRLVEEPAPLVVATPPGMSSLAGKPTPLHLTDRPRPALIARWRVPAIAAGLVVLLGGGITAVRRNASAPPVVGVSSPVTAEEGLQVHPALAPNGRLVAYAAGTSQQMRIVVRRTAGGAPWPLTRDSTAWELLPRWSPDNDEILFLSGNSAYLAPAVGGVPRLLAEGGSDSANVRSASWSPAGDSVVIVRHDSVLVLPREGRGARFVGRGAQLHSCVWSPDARWIACVSGNWIAYVRGPAFGNRAPSGIVLFPARGGEAVPVTDRVHEHFSPAWSADGRWLWFVSSRDGTPGEAYMVAVGRNGRVNGPVHRIGLGAEFLSVAGERLAYAAPSRTANIWAIPVAEDRVQRVADANRVTSGNQVIEVVHASADGAWLVYDSNLRGNPDIYRLPLAGGPRERLTDDVEPEFAGALSPDGREIAYHRWVDGRRRVHLRGVTDGIVREAIPSPGDQGVPRWSHDGNALAIWEHDWEPGAIMVVRRDTAGLWGPPRWKLRGAQLPIWSPDGLAIAYLKPSGEVLRISADSGAAESLYLPAPESDDPIATFLAWDAGRDRIWFLGSRPSGAAGIWWIPADGSAPPRLAVDLRDPDGRVPGLPLTTDGRRLFFTLEARMSNVRVAEVEQR